MKVIWIKILLFQTSTQSDKRGQQQRLRLQHVFALRILRLSKMFTGSVQSVAIRSPHKEVNFSY